MKARVLAAEEKIRVLFWPGWWYPSRISPLGGIFVQRHAEAASRFCDVSVLFIVADPGMKGKYSVEHGKEKDLRVTRIYYRPARRIPLLGKLIDMATYYRLARIGNRSIREESGPPDIVHVHVNPPLGLIVYLLTRIRRIPAVFTEHWSGYFRESGGYKGFYRKLFTRALVKHCKAVTVASQASERAMERHGLWGTYHVIPNAVDTALFAPGPPDGKKDKKKVLHVSGFNPCKNIGGIIRAVNQTAKKRDDFELHMIGDSMEREKMETLADALHIKDRMVFFHGRMDAAEVAEHMKQADFLLLFSDYENSPCVIAEAFAAGIPVIATRTGGIPEHVHEDTGILVNPGDEEELARALVVMLDNSQNYDRAKIRDYALKTFHSEIIGRSFFDIYRKLIAASGKESAKDSG
jgi:glycosyltransferase involved in cell wall biosynthesis